MTRGESCAVHCMQQKDNSAGTFLVGHILSKAEQPYLSSNTQLFLEKLQVKQLKTR